VAEERAWNADSKTVKETKWRDVINKKQKMEKDYLTSMKESETKSMMKIS